MKKEINSQELETRIDLNFDRLLDPRYSDVEKVFMPANYDWYADMEGRALLAFVSHYKINGKINPCMEKIIEKLPNALNEKGMYTDSDIIYCEVEKEFSKYTKDTIEHDGHILCPIIKMWKVPEEDAKNIKMKVLFK